MTSEKTITLNTKTLTDSIMNLLAQGELAFVISVKIDHTVNTDNHKVQCAHFGLDLLGDVNISAEYQKIAEAVWKSVRAVFEQMVVNEVKKLKKEVTQA